MYRNTFRQASESREKNQRTYQHIWKNLKEKFARTTAIILLCSSPALGCGSSSIQPTAPAQEQTGIGKSKDTTIDSLVKTLSEGDAKARVYAAEALENAALKGADISPVVEALGNALSYLDVEARKGAARALGNAVMNEKSRDAAIRTLVKKALFDKNPSVRDCVTEALRDAAGNVKTRDAAINALVNALSDGDVQVREGAGWALWGAAGKTDITPAIGSLLKALSDGNEAVRKGAARALGGAVFNEESRVAAINALVNALSDEDGGKREGASEALMQAAQYTDITPAVDALGNALSGWNVHVRVNASRALEYALMNEKSRDVAMKTLVKALSDGDVRVRGKAAEALWGAAKRTDITPAIGVLVKAASDEDGNVRDYAYEALSLASQRSASAKP